jgi:hypothetical protein
VNNLLVPRVLTVTRFFSFVQTRANLTRFIARVARCVCPTMTAVTARSTVLMAKTSNTAVSNTTIARI